MRFLIIHQVIYQVFCSSGAGGSKSFACMLAPQDHYRSYKRMGEHERAWVLSPLSISSSFALLVEVFIMH